MAKASKNMPRDVRTEVLHVRVTKSQLSQLKLIAALNNRSVINQVFAIIADALKGVK